MSWFLYVLECADGSLYTGITNDLDRRIAQHENGKGAKYTRGRGPFTLKFSAEYPDRGQASSAEHAFKSLSRSDKLAFLTGA